MGYSADKSPLIGHLAGPIRRLKPLGAQRQEKCGPNHLTREGLHATTPLAADRAMYGPTPTVTPTWSVSTAMVMSGQEALHPASVGLRHRSATGSTATTRRHRLRGRS